MNFANTFLRTPFYRTHPVAAPVKACNFTNIRLQHGWFFVNLLKLFGTYFDALLEFSKSSQKYWRKKFAKYLSADGCFVKTITINCDDNDDATCFLILGRLLLIGSSCKEISLEVLEQFICVAARSMSTKVLICKKTEDEPAYCPDRYELLQMLRPCKNSNSFQKVVQLFNLMQDYFPIRDSKRLECVKSAFKRRNSTALSKFSIFSNTR